MSTDRTLPSTYRVSPPTKSIYKRFKSARGILDGILFYSVLVFAMFLLSPGFLILGLAWTLIHHAIIWGIEWAWILIRSIS